MPLLTLLPLILSGIKLAMDLVAYLQAHPELEAEVKATVDRAAFTLSQAHADLSALKPTEIEAP